MGLSALLFAWLDLRVTTGGKVDRALRGVRRGTNDGGSWHVASRVILVSGAVSLDDAASTATWNDGRPGRTSSSLADNTAE